MIGSVTRRAVQKARRIVRTSPLYVRHRSDAINVYHCCVPRTGSQWIRALLRDERVYRYSGLTYHNYLARFPDHVDLRRMTERNETEPFPPGRIASPLYFDYGSFFSIPKPRAYRAFFIARDPRDLVVSWYFSMKRTHKLLGRVPEWREELNRLSKSEGLAYSIRTMDRDAEIFRTLRSWAERGASDPNVLIVSYEDLTGPDAPAAFRQLLEHCDIRLPDSQLKRLLSDHSFAKKTGRSRGQEDRGSQMRKGVAGDWTNHLDSGMLADLEDVAGDLIERFGRSTERGQVDG
jgi:hypothetical protein